MAQNQVYLIKSGENSFVEETQAIVGISGGKVGIGTTHPEADLHVTGSVKVDGDLTVDGTLTTINSSTVSVDDINIELGSTDNPTDGTAEGGGITVKGDTDKTFNWHANGGWTSSENLSVADGKHFAGDELRALDAGGLSLFDTNQSGITIKGGKVGIHQAAPGYDLDVDGSGNFGSLYVDGNAVLTGEGSIFGKWEDGATQGEIFYTGGNVGVGTTNPEHNFHVVGNGAVDGNFVVNGTSGTFNVGEFDVSGSNITLNSAGGGLDSSRGGLIVNGDNGTGKLEYLDSTQTWQSNQDIQIVADKHLQTDKVRAIDDEGLYLQDDGGNGIYIQDGGNVNIAKQVNVVGLTKADGGLNVGNGKFNIQSDGTLGSVNPNADDVIKWDGTKWVAAVSPGGGGGGTSEVPNALINSLIAGESIQQITYGPYDSTPKIATDLEIVGDGSVIPYALSGVSETGYFAVFSQEIPNNNYKIHTVFGGKDVYWETGSSSSIYYNDGDVSLQRNLTVGGNLTVAGSTTSINTQTLEIKDHNLVIASNTGHNQLVDPYAGSHAGILWGTGDAGDASPVSLTYQSNKGFAFEGGNVGIGETAPVNPLHILVDTVDTQEFTTSGNGGAIFLESNSPSSQGEYGSAINFTRREGSSHRRKAAIVSKQYSGDGEDVGLAFFTANGDTESNSNVGEVLQLRGNGDAVFNNNVGIGTTNPGAELDVRGNIVAVGSNISVTNGGSASGVGIYSPASNEMGISTNSSEAMRIDSDGNVGIGTTNPSMKVNIYHSDEDGLRFNTADTLATFIDFGDTSDNNIGRISYDHSDNHMAIRTNNKERMRIDSGGNAGIGTTNPKDELHINSAGTNVNLRLTRDGDTGGRISCSDGADTPAIIFETIASNTLSERMRIDSGGNVGIGTANPGGKLHVATKDTLISGTVSTVSSNLLTASGSSFLTELSVGDSLLIEGEDTYTVTAINSETQVQLSSNITANGGEKLYRTNNKNLFFISEKTGNIGIGTTSPGAKLDIFGSNSSLKFTRDQGDRSAEMLYDGSKFLIKTPPGDRLSIADTSSNELLTVNPNNGNVGIGTTSPGAKLQLQGNFLVSNSTDNSVLSKIRILGTSSASGDGHIIFQNNNSTASRNFYIGSDITDGAAAPNGLSIKSSGYNTTSWADATTHLHITNSGNVGIGTTNPSAKLHVDSGEAELTFGNNASGGNANLRIWRNDSSIAIDNPLGYLSFAGSDAATSPTDHAAISAIAEESHEYTSDPLSEKNGTQLTFFTTNLGQSAMSRKMTISANGNVGIGTTSPRASLDVIGDINSSNNIGANSTYTLFTARSTRTIDDYGGLYKQYVGLNLVTPGASTTGESSAHAFGDLRFQLANSNSTNSLADIMTLRYNGNVGIGTTNPNVKLDVIGSIEYTGTITDVSDQRKKENVQDLENSLSKICQLNGKSYEMIDDNEGEEGTELGFIAQEVQQIFPEIVKVVERQESEDGETQEYLGVSYIQLIAPLVESIKEQQTIIEDLKSQNESLAARISALES